MFQPSAKIIADSINLETGDRLTTMILNYHRFIHSEFMTYRMFSRNAASSRAISIKKNIEHVKNLDLYPLHWGKNQKGMQAVEEIENIFFAKEIWESAKLDAIRNAETLDQLGVHKQIVNRILEPFNDITVICTSNQKSYQHLFDERCNSNAQPEIQALAYTMKDSLEKSIPKELKDNEWHVPFNKFEKVVNTIYLKDEYLVNDENNMKDFDIRDVLKVSVACCARVSYLNHDGSRDVQNDLELHDKLLASKPPHLSPFEHQAVVSNGKFANFTGFRSYRNILESLEVV